MSSVARQLRLRTARSVYTSLSKPAPFSSTAPSATDKLKPMTAQDLIAVAKSELDRSRAVSKSGEAGPAAGAAPARKGLSAEELEMRVMGNWTDGGNGVGVGADGVKKA